MLKSFSVIMAWLLKKRLYCLLKLLAIFLQNNKVNVASTCTLYYTVYFVGVWNK